MYIRKETRWLALAIALATALAVLAIGSAPASGQSLAPKEVRRDCSVTDGLRIEWGAVAGSFDRYDIFSKPPGGNADWRAGVSRGTTSYEFDDLSLAGHSFQIALKTGSTVSGWGPMYALDSCATTPSTTTTTTPPPAGSSSGCPRDVTWQSTTAIPRPCKVRVERSGSQLTLVWEMPARGTFQFTVFRNNPTTSARRPFTGSNANWNQSDANPTNSTVTTSDGVRTHRYVLPQSTSIVAGEAFNVTPYVPGGSSGKASLFGTVPVRPGHVTQTRAPFADAIRTDRGTIPSESWVGDPDSWTLQFDEEFEGSGQLSARTTGNQWYFADGARGYDADVDPASSRAPEYDLDHAELTTDAGASVLKMTIDDNGYSYIASGSGPAWPAANTADGRRGYFIDASNDVFIETSVRLDEATPANHAWWAFWLMTPGLPAGTSGASNLYAYNGVIDDGSEVDIFEFVPDRTNGYNAAIFRKPADTRGCDWTGDQIADDTDQSLRRGSPSEALGAGTNRGTCFSYATPTDEAGLGFGAGDVNYLDGDYHRIGLYYTHDRMQMFIDDVKIFETTDQSWITKSRTLAIRLTWEQWRDDEAVQWTGDVGRFSDTYLIDGQYPTAYIDWVKVWERDTDGSGPESSARGEAMAAVVDALEGWGSARGTYVVSGSGWNGGGQGWLHFDSSARYSTSIASVLSGSGFGSVGAMRDPIHVSSSSATGDFLIYRCRDRVGVFTRHGDGSLTSSADRSWWDSNGCTRYPLDGAGATDVILTAPLGDLTVDPAMSARGEAMAAVVDALEGWGSARGTYVVSGSGWNGGGQGWLHFDSSARYSTSIASVLSGSGFGSVGAMRDPIHVSSSSATGDFLIYRCRDRVGVFTRHGDGSLTSSADRSWWDSNGCTRYPLDGAGATDVVLTAPLGDL